MSNFDTDDKEFIKSLDFDNLKNAYIDAKKKLFLEIDQKYTQQHAELVERKLYEIEKDKQHRMILNTCIFPFIENGPLTKYGYHFIYASPLCEKKVPNFDFLIFHPDPPYIAIFGEAKGSITSPLQTIQQTRDRMKIVYDFKDYITEKYLKTKSQFEFVNCSGFPDAHDLMKTIVLQGGGIIVWCSSRPILGNNSQHEMLELLIPGNEDIKKSMMHRDHELNKYLHKVRTSKECKDFFIDSHRFAKLLVITVVDRTKKDGIFTFDDLYDLVTDTLDYLDEGTIRKETEEILKFAKDNLGFVQELKEQPEYYRITLRSKKADAREKELRDKWIDYQIEQEKDEEKYLGLTQIQQEFRNKRNLQKNIDEFMSK